MFGIGTPELLVILAVALIVIGPKKLPELAKSLGRALGEFKRATNDLKQSLEQESGLDEVREHFKGARQDAFSAMNPDRSKKSSSPDASSSQADPPALPAANDPKTLPRSETNEPVSSSPGAPAASDPEASSGGAVAGNEAQPEDDEEKSKE